MDFLRILLLIQIIKRLFDLLVLILWWLVMYFYKLASSSLLASRLKEMKEKRFSGKGRHFSGISHHFSGKASLFTCLIVTLLWLLYLLQYLLTFHSLKIIWILLWLTTTMHNQVQKRWSMHDKSDARKVSASIIWKSLSYCIDWCLFWETVLNLGRFMF